MQALEVGVKLFVANPKAVALKDYIPIFHRWIQAQGLDELCIDVADYGHVHHGPGVILMCNGAIYGLDEEGGKLGLLLRRKRNDGGTLQAQMLATLRALLVAAHKLMQEPELLGRLDFVGNALEVSIYNRLHAPNTEETFAQVKPYLDATLSKLWLGQNYTLQREPEPRERFLVRASCDTNVGVSELLERVRNEAGRG